MDPLSREYIDAGSKVTNEYCVACYIRGLILDDEPIISEMEPRWSMIAERPHREDIQMKCPNPDCLTVRMKGVGVSESEFDEKLERRGGSKMLDFANTRIPEVDLDSLRHLGYVV